MSPGPAFIAEWTAASVAAAVSPPCCAISSGVTPVLTANMYTTGMIMRPATTAMIVSNISMRRTDPSMESSFFIYEP